VEIGRLVFVLLRGGPMGGELTLKEGGSVTSGLLVNRPESPKRLGRLQLLQSCDPHRNYCSNV
jgi:hypothetical protein